MALTLAEYKVQVDWDNNGGFGQLGFPYWFPFAFHTGIAIGDALEDISADAREFSWSRGRDAELDKTETGEASVSVIDTIGKYIPQNTASVLYDYVKPSRQVMIRAKHAGIIYPLFRGYLDDVLPEPHIEERRAVLPCLDGLDKLARDKVTMALQKNKKSGQLFGETLDKVSWDAVRRALDTGIDTYPMVYTDRRAARGFLDSVALTEFGLFYVDGRGYFDWEDRHHRLHAPHTVSQWVCSADKYVDIEPTESLKSIRNVIIIDAQPYTLALAESDIWRLWENKDNIPADSPLLEPGQNYDYWAKFIEIADEVVAPAATTDYLGNTAQDGSGVDKTAQLTVTATIFAQSTKITVTNNDAANVYLTLLKVRGKLYSTNERLEIVEEDAISKAAYGERHLPISLPYYQSSDVMRDIADHQLATKKDPWSGYRVTLVGDADDILTQILARKISDRITLQNATYNIDDDFYIDKMEHKVGEDKIHRCRWMLSKADDQFYWVMDVSQLDITTRLAY